MKLAYIFFYKQRINAGKEFDVMDREFSKRMQEKLDELKNANEPQPIRSDGAGKSPAENYRLIKP